MYRMYVKDYFKKDRYYIGIKLIKLINLQLYSDNNTQCRVRFRTKENPIDVKDNIAL